MKKIDGFLLLLALFPALVYANDSDDEYYSAMVPSYKPDMPVPMSRSMSEPRNLDQHYIAPSFSMPTGPGVSDKNIFNDTDENMWDLLNKHFHPGDAVPLLNEVMAAYQGDVSTSFFETVKQWAMNSGAALKNYAESNPKKLMLMAGLLTLPVTYPILDYGLPTAIYYGAPTLGSFALTQGVDKSINYLFPKK